MNSYSILGDYVAADFLPAPESRFEAQLPFSGIRKIVLDSKSSREEDERAVREYLKPLFEKKADYLLIDLQDTGMLEGPQENEADPLQCSRNRWKLVIGIAARQILEVYAPQELIVNEHYSSTVYLDGDEFRTYENSVRIGRCNMLMRFLFTEIENAAKGCHIIPFPVDVFDVAILWEGEKEYQYHPGYYCYGQKAVRIILDRDVTSRAQEENRIAIEHEQCSEYMSWLSQAPVLAAEEDRAQRRRIRGLRQEAAGSDWVFLYWEENIYAADYLIERYDNGIWEYVDMIDAVTEPCARVEGLLPDTEYYFRVNVKAEDTAGRYGQTIVCRTKKTGEE